MERDRAALYKDSDVVEEFRRVIPADPALRSEEKFETARRIVDLAKQHGFTRRAEIYSPGDHDMRNKVSNAMRASLSRS